MSTIPTESLRPVASATDRRRLIHPRLKAWYSVFDRIEFRKEQQDVLIKERNRYVQRTDKIYLDRLDGRITDSEYDNYYTRFRTEIADIDAQLELLQDAEDNYYFTGKYVLELANRAHDLFLSSEIEEKRQILKLVLPNLQLEGKNLKFSLVKPFDTIFDCANNQQWRP